MKIAIIGTGISGMSTAYFLSQKHDVSVFEKEDYVGGHSRTLTFIENSKEISVDTGFIVFNHKNYPNLLALFRHLEVPTIKSNMSFGVSINNAWLEYGTMKLSNLFSQKRNFFRPSYLKMLQDVLKFNKKALFYIDNQTDKTIGDMIEDLKLGEWFKNYYLLPMSGAIWSTPVEDMLNFPAETLVRFFHNHGLLTVDEQPQWYTVKGGSKEYVTRLTRNIKKNIQTNLAVSSVTRDKNSATITDSNGDKHQFDAVIFACHSDQALALIAIPSKEEKSVLGRIQYKPNSVILHQDSSFMPKRKSAWSSWVYLSNSNKDKTNKMSLTYWMNSLQSIESTKPILVTLNPSVKPKEELIINEHIFDHPQFNQDAISAQKDIPLIQGVDKFWFCGAWQKYGFHEDGLSSAINVVKDFGVKLPWE
ncbi:FAD-dependent oxidoreductase [Gammaproteobacteria bacterium]|nr:FAD-dependent oxidoreductase [Gammaproteobacteria bacterium]